MKKLFSNRLVLILLIAIVLRVYAIDRLPPGLFADEAVEGLDALDVLAGKWAVWFPSQEGREPIYVYLVAISYALFGVNALATRLPAILIGIVTIPATYWFVREWAREILPPARARRAARLAAALVAISFWHIQMSRDAHRDILLPLVEAVGFALLWRAANTVIARRRPERSEGSPTKQSPSSTLEIASQQPLATLAPHASAGVTLSQWSLFAAAGAVLGLAIYTYSPGRFVSVFLVLFFLLELIFASFAHRASFTPFRVLARGTVIVAVCAFIVMLPLLLYFAQNPAQFSQRFNTTSVFRADDPLGALTSSVMGNLTMFVVPDAGYQSQHYNLPGKPVFDLLIAAWFVAGVAIALARAKRAEYRFLLLWFAVMLVPAFLTADMIPKGVRAFGVVPGVFVFAALGMENLDFRIQNSDFRLHNSQLAIRYSPFAIRCLIVVSILGSLVWTTYDYFIAWANLPTLPAAFDVSYVDAANYVRAQPASQMIYVSAERYRHPTFMLLGKQVPTTRYLDRAKRVREFDARTSFVVGANETGAQYVFVDDAAPSDAWLARIAAPAAPTEHHATLTIFRPARLVPPAQTLDRSFHSGLKLVGYTRFEDEPRGIALYWQVLALPTDRAEMQSRVASLDARSQVITQSAHRFGAPPLEWAIGDGIVEWFEIAADDRAMRFSVQLQRGADKWEEVIGE